MFTDKLTVIVKQSQSVVGEGRTAHFTAMGNGINTMGFKYQWRKRDSDRLLDRVLSDTKEVLTIPNVLESDEGYYYCIVTNEWGRSVESDNVSLIVQGTYSKY